jgi:hypothetical protein
LLLVLTIRPVDAVQAKFRRQQLLKVASLVTVCQGPVATGRRMIIPAENGKVCREVKRIATSMKLPF